MRRWLIFSAIVGCALSVHAEQQVRATQVRVSTNLMSRVRGTNVQVALDWVDDNWDTNSYVKASVFDSGVRGIVTGYGYDPATNVNAKIAAVTDSLNAAVTNLQNLVSTNSVPGTNIVGAAYSNSQWYINSLDATNFYRKVRGVRMLDNANASVFNGTITGSSVPITSVANRVVSSISPDFTNYVSSVDGSKWRFNFPESGVWFVSWVGRGSTKGSGSDTYVLLRDSGNALKTFFVGNILQSTNFTSIASGGSAIWSVEVGDYAQAELLGSTSVTNVLAYMQFELYKLVETEVYPR